MLSVKGTFRNGVVTPDEPVEGRDGQLVIITFLEEGSISPSPSSNEAAWETLTQMVEQCAAETGITDLAHQHDHYLYGKPKKE